MPTVNIDGISQKFDTGTLILDAAKALGIEIPTFCSHPRLEPLAACRMCLIEVEGQRKLLPSCATTISEGMVVHTESATVVATRKTMLEMLLANHPLDCPVCDKGGECRLQDQVFQYGAPESRFDENKRRFHNQDLPLNHVVVANLNRCIQCQLCVRYCDEVVGAQALGAIGIGSNTIATGFMDSLADCDHCGNCIEVCPVGALMNIPYRYQARPWDLKEVDTVCPFCGTGCQLTVGARDRELKRVRSKTECGLNRESLCVRGRFGMDVSTQTQHRIQQPMIRRNQELVAVSWEEAYELIRQQHQQIQKNNKSIGGMISASMTNETLYGFAQLMRQVFSSNNIDSYCRWPLAEAYPMLKQLMNRFYLRQPLEKVLATDSCLIIGSNVTDENPVSEYLIREAHRNQEFDLTVLSTRPSRLDRIANAHQRYLPGNEAKLIGALLKGLDGGEESTQDATGPWVEHLHQSLPRAQRITLLLGSDLLRSPCIGQTLRLLNNLLSALQATGKQPGLQFLLDRCNQLGTWDLGVHSPCDVEQILQQCERQEMAMLYVVGEDPLVSCPDGERVANALQQLDLLVVQDNFMTDSALAADLVLPNFNFAEHSGTFTNNEGRVQRLRPIYPPPVKSIMDDDSANVIYPPVEQLNAKRDTDIFNAIASTLGVELGLNSLEGVFADIKNAVPSYRSIDVSRLADNGQFSTRPTGDEKSDETASIPEQSYHCVPIESCPESGACAQPSPQFHLITGNCLFHSGYITQHSPTLTAIAEQAYVEINDQDARTLNLFDGDKVVVSGASYSVTLKLKCSPNFPSAVAFIPENFNQVRLNLFSNNGEYPCLVVIHAQQPEGEQTQLVHADSSINDLPGRPE